MVCACHEPLLGEEVLRQIIAVVPQPVIRYVNDKWFQLIDRFLILYGFKQHFVIAVLSSYIQLQCETKFELHVFHTNQTLLLSFETGHNSIDLPS